MPRITLDLDEDKNSIVEQYKLIHKTKDKVTALLEIIAKYDIEKDIKEYETIPKNKEIVDGAKNKG